MNVAQHNKRYTVLVVDDSPDNIDILSELLDPFYRIRVAAHGRRALEILEGEQMPDLVLLDAVMPGMDGFEVCRRIKAHPRMAQIPVLFVTSLDQADEETSALSMGAADYITKPFSAAVVLARVRTHLELADHTNRLEHTVRERTMALAESERRLRLALAAGNLGIYDCDLGRNSMSVSAEHMATLGLDPSGFDGTLDSWVLRVHEADRLTFASTCQQVRDGLIHEFEFECRCRSKSGTWLWMLFTGKVVDLPCWGLGPIVTGTLVDVTTRKQQEIRLGQAAQVFTNAVESITITDEEGVFVEVNAAFTAMTGYSRDEAVGRIALDLLNAEVQSKEFLQRREHILEESGQWTGEMWIRRKNGEIFPAMMNVNVARQPDGRIGSRIAFTVDLTEQKQHQNQLQRIAQYDTLTNLPNRSLFRDRLQQAMANTRRQRDFLAVATIDVDEFKSINDRYGNDIGDQVLLALSQRLLSFMREGDTLARTGGNEFMVMLVGIEGESTCRMLMNRLLLAITDPIPLETTQLQVTASAGVTLYPSDDADIDMLLRHAHQAMFLAKQGGKSRFHLFDIDADKAVRTRQETIEHVEQALRANEFVLFYQPKVNIRTGEVVGAEALLRWQHPQRGLLSPAVFLPVVEGSQLSIAMGEWVIREALSQMVRWSDAGLDLPVSVNIGALQLQQRNFSQRLRELLGEFPGVEPSRLELEILETSALVDISWASEVIRMCQSLGVRFALDDFGTGYSSLSYLKRLPCETLKIDQSFVRDMLIDPDDLSIVQTVIGLSAAFRRDVIAEGVETVAHAQRLAELDCVLVQGYGIARPMSASAMFDWVHSWRVAPLVFNA